MNREESERSGMAVLDITIPTGYWIQQQKLDAYVLSNRVRNLRRAKYFNQKVVFYFDYVRVAPSTGQLEGVVALTRIICVFFFLDSFFQLDQEDICVNFTIERWYPVANMSRYLPIRVYDYYAPGKLLFHLIIIMVLS